MNAIEVKNLTVQFKETRALDNVSAEFEEGKIHGLVGRNGSGKTVLMKCICGFLPVKKGIVTVFGKRIGKDIDIPDDIGIIIENPGFLPAFSGYQNLSYLASIRGKIKKKEIYEFMNYVGLNPKSKKHVSKYSLGMRQRLAIAQALMEDPQLLLLDEPMNGLDNQGVQEIRDLLLKLKSQGKTIVLSSHNLLDIATLCDTVYELDQGVISLAPKDKYKIQGVY